MLGNTANMFGGSLAFDHRSQEWSIFRSRFIQYCTANDINSNTDKSGVKRRALLLTAMVEETFRVANDLVFPADLDNVEYETLLEKLTNHFQAKRCTFAERFIFYKAEQRPREDLAEWAVRVRSLARFCGFKSELETALRDRFVLGLENIKEKERLFAEDIETLTFSKALELAQSVHCARMALLSARNSTVAAATFPVETSAQPVFAMRAATSSSATGVIPSKNFNSSRVARCCDVCGYKNHKSDMCRFSNYKCQKCNKKGHLKRVCKYKAMDSNYLGADDDNVIGDKVLVKHFYNNCNKWCWKDGIVRSQLGTRMFTVFIPELNCIVKKDVDHLLAYKGGSSVDVPDDISICEFEGHAYNRANSEPKLSDTAPALIAEPLKNCT